MTTPPTDVIKPRTFPYYLEHSHRTEVDMWATGNRMTYIRIIIKNIRIIVMFVIFIVRPMSIIIMMIMITNTAMHDQGNTFYAKVNVFDKQLITL